MITEKHTFYETLLVGVSSLGERLLLAKIMKKNAF